MADTTLASRAQELKSLVDVLLPGDGLFPAASAVGTHGLLAERLRDRLGVAGVDQVLAALEGATGGAPLNTLDREERIAAVCLFEKEQPALFATVLNILYYSYYQSPLVVEAVRGLGIVYNDAPQPLGYALEPFQPTPGVGIPAQPRGFYLKTEEVRRIILPEAARATRSEQQ